MLERGVADTRQLLNKLNPRVQGNGNVSTVVNKGGGGFLALINFGTSRAESLGGQRMLTNTVEL